MNTEARRRRAPWLAPHPDVTGAREGNHSPDSESLVHPVGRSAPHPSGGHAARRASCASGPGSDFPLARGKRGALGDADRRAGRVRRVGGDAGGSLEGTRTAHGEAGPLIGVSPPCVVRVLPPSPRAVLDAAPFGSRASGTHYEL